MRMGEMSLEGCPETEGARLTNFLCVRSLVKSPLVNDRSPLQTEAERGLIMDAMYKGVVPEWIYYMRMEIVKALRARMESQY